MQLKLLVKRFQPVLPFLMNVSLLNVFKLVAFPVMTHLSNYIVPLYLSCYINFLDLIVPKESALYLEDLFSLCSSDK